MFFYVHVHVNFNTMLNVISIKVYFLVYIYHRTEKYQMNTKLLKLYKICYHMAFLVSIKVFTFPG